MIAFSSWQEQATEVVEQAAAGAADLGAQANEQAVSVFWTVMQWRLIEFPPAKEGADPRAVTVYNVTVIAAVILGAFLISRLIQRAMARGFERRQLRDEGTLIAAQRLTHYVVMTIGVFVGFKLGSIDLTGLFAAGAVFAVVLGFAMQNITENFVGGLILMVERSITPGDILEVEGTVSRVVRVGNRATVLRTRDEEELIVPNSVLVRSTVKNYTLGDRFYRLRAQVGVTYSSDLDLVRSVLEETAREVPFRVKEREPRILLWAFGSSSVDYDVSIWIEDPWHAQDARSKFQESIWRAFKEAGIVIAFPQLDLHLDAPVEQSIERLTGRP